MKGLQMFFFIKEMVKNVLEKLDTILDEPSKSCGDFIDKALQAIEHKCPKDAKGYFEKAVENAVKGKLQYERFIFIFLSISICYH